MQLCIALRLSLYESFAQCIQRCELLHTDAVFYCDSLAQFGH
jgi:hypothetical protein